MMMAMTKKNDDDDDGDDYVGDDDSFLFSRQWGMKNALQSCFRTPADFKVPAHGRFKVHVWGSASRTATSESVRVQLLVGWWGGGGGTKPEHNVPPKESCTCLLRCNTLQV